MVKEFWLNLMTLPARSCPLAGHIKIPKTGKGLFDLSIDYFRRHQPPLIGSFIIVGITPPCVRSGNIDHLHLRRDAGIARLKTLQHLFSNSLLFQPRSSGRSFCSSFHQSHSVSNITCTTVLPGGANLSV